MSRITNFRTGDKEELILTEACNLLGIQNESELIRALLNYGLLYIKELYGKVEICITPIKNSQIDYFFSSMKINLMKKRKEESQANQPRP